MFLPSTRFGATDPGLPGPMPLPFVSAILSRRASLFGAVTIASVSPAALMSAAGVPVADGRL